MGSYISRHLQVLFSTLGDLRRTPIATLNTLMIVAITLLLPCLLYIAVQSAKNLSGTWQGRPQVSIFLNKQINDGEAQLIFDEIRLHPSVELAEFISPDQALQEFRILSGRNDGASGLDLELEFLGANPLPPSIVVMPDQQTSDAESLTLLEQQLSKIDGIDTIRLDLEWTNKFTAILAVFTRIAALLSGLLAIGLILIVSNTIKMLILNRRQEIEITKLVGGTDAFVRRPFLYYGTLFGVFGAIITLFLLFLAGSLIQQPLAQLASAYQSNSLAYSLNGLEVTAVIAIGASLGWLAARWSVAQHLRHIHPR